MVSIQIENIFIHGNYLTKEGDGGDNNRKKNLESMTEIDARLFPHSPLYSSIYLSIDIVYSHTYDTVERYLSNGIAFVVTFIVWNDCNFRIVLLLLQSADILFNLTSLKR